MSVQEQDVKIFELIRQIAQQLELEIVEVKIARHQNDAMIQVLADKPLGGISIGACTQLNRSVVEAIDKSGFFSEDGYSLEVSSPGLDRPLVTYKDFLRNLDYEVHIWLKDKLDNKTELEGVIKSANEQNLGVLLPKAKQETMVPMGLILKGILVI